MLVGKKFRRLRGMRDLLPEDVAKLNYVKSVVRELFRLYGYREVLTPTLEFFSLLAAKSGEDIRRRMYVFTDLGGRRVALRPEMTAPIARFYINNMTSYPKPLRLGYIVNCFRYDEPQYGRYREFWQGGFELIGSRKPESDVEILEIADALLKRLGFSNHYIKVNHIGIMREILESEGVSSEYQNRVFTLLDKGKLVDALSLLRSLGVSEKFMEIAKSLFSLKGFNYSDFIGSVEKLLVDYEGALIAFENFKQILELSEKCGLAGRLLVDFSFARGLEYYTGMIFEVYAPPVRVALGGGGRYDKLIELFGGEPTPAVGYAPGLDRIVLAMDELKIPFKYEKYVRVFVVPVDVNVKSEAVKIAYKLRSVDISAELEVMGRSLKRALSYASNMDFSHVIIVGEKELSRGKIVLRDLEKNVQFEVTLEEAIKLLKNNLFMRG